ncbi:MAG TPA: hypothetical protein VFE18_16285 [Phenylobacterium sp.]|jgi:hypothetical protein|nr:hypothetical protein [Phenylobacterium sp.]HZZ69732.1 hypothetical protein [Phenylobacterium sp.]
MIELYHAFTANHDPFKWVALAEVSIVFAMVVIVPTVLLIRDLMRSR